MPLHIKKLCVGAESAADLEAWQQTKCLTLSRVKGYDGPFHTTRMVPKRAAEVLDGGSIYWVIKGSIRVRQRITDIVEFTDEEGIKRCDLVFDSALVAVRARPSRPFQGWRYMKPGDAPRDLGVSAEEAGDPLPGELRDALTELCLI